VGIEDVNDLIEDLEQAFARAISVRHKKVVALGR